MLSTPPLPVGDLPGNKWPTPNCGQHRSWPMVVSSPGFRDAWSLGRGRWETARSWQIPGIAGNAREAQQPHQAPGIVPTVCRFGLGGRSGSLVRVPYRSGRGEKLTRPDASGLSRPPRRKIADSGRSARRWHMPDSNRQPTRQPRFYGLISAFFSNDGGARSLEYLIQ